MADIRIIDLPNEDNPVASEKVAIDGATTRGTTIQKLVDSGAPVASQAEAEAGANNVKRMTPLRAKQYVEAQVGVSIASAAQGALAATAVQPEDLGTSAPLDVGTTAGTVAAGDDERIVSSFKSLRPETNDVFTRQRLDAIVGQDVTDIGNQGIGFPLNPPLVPFAATGVKSYEIAHQRGPHLGAALATKAFIKKTSGSGFFGPQEADIALLLSGEKVTYDGDGNELGDWLTAQAEGEIDTLISIVRQGHKGDAGGVIVDARKVRDGSEGETGGVAGMEIAVALVNESNEPSHSIHWLPAYGESEFGISGGDGFGSYAETRAGRWYAAYFAGNVGADSELNENPALGDDRFDYVLVASDSRDPTGADIYFAIEADVAGGKPGGLIIGKHGNRRTVRYDPDSGYISVQKGDGTFLLTIGPTGVTTVGSGLQIGGGTVQGLLKVVSGAFDPGSIAAHSTIDLIQLACLGSLPGDMVTATCTSADGSFRDFELSGIVYDADTVTLRGHNKTDSAIDFGSFTYLIKVERFT